MTMAPVAEMLGVEWMHEATFPVFEEHEWIESSEIIEDQLLATLPEGRAANLSSGGVGCLTRTHMESSEYCNFSETVDYNDKKEIEDVAARRTVGRA